MLRPGHLILKEKSDRQERNGLKQLNKGKGQKWRRATKINSVQSRCEEKHQKRRRLLSSLGVFSYHFITVTHTQIAFHLHNPAHEHWSHGYASKEAMTYVV